MLLSLRIVRAITWELKSRRYARRASIHKTVATTTTKASSYAWWVSRDGHCSGITCGHYIPRWYTHHSTKLLMLLATTHLRRRRIIRHGLSSQRGVSGSLCTWRRKDLRGLKMRSKDVGQKEGGWLKKRRRSHAAVRIKDEKEIKNRPPPNQVIIP